jgi:hypothetical protein
MRLFAPAVSVPNAQAGEKRGRIAAHKYKGFTSFQRTSPRSRRDCGDATASGTIDSRVKVLGAEIGQKTTSMSLISESLFLLDAVVKRRFDGLMILERISGKVA